MGRGKETHAPSLCTEQRQREVLTLLTVKQAFVVRCGRNPTVSAEKAVPSAPEKGDFSPLLRVGSSICILQHHCWLHNQHLDGSFSPTLLLALEIKSSPSQPQQGKQLLCNPTPKEWALRRDTP